MAGAGATGPACAVCGKPQVRALRPFCSKRCADVDLSRWLKGAYAIPAVEPPDGVPPGGEGPDDLRD